MKKRLRDRLTYANVVATLALIVAVAGGSTAIAISIAPRNSVTSESIRAGNVVAEDLGKTRVRIASNGGSGVVVSRCAKGERLIGGGSSPVGGASVPAKNGWLASGTGLSRAYALCLAARP